MEEVECRLSPERQCRPGHIRAEKEQSESRQKGRADRGVDVKQAAAGLVRQDEKERE